MGSSIAGHSGGTLFLVYIWCASDVPELQAAWLAVAPPLPNCPQFSLVPMTYCLVWCNQSRAQEQTKEERATRRRASNEAKGGKREREGHAKVVPSAFVYSERGISS